MAAGLDTIPFVDENGRPYAKRAYNEGDVGNTSGPFESVVRVLPLSVPWTDRSGAITQTDGNQLVAAANAKRVGLLIENPPTAEEQGLAVAENLRINYSSPAGPSFGGLIILTPGGTINTATGPCTPESIFVQADTVGHLYTYKEQLLP